MQVLIKKAAILDIPPCSAVGRISGLALLEDRNTASIDKGGSRFGVGRGVRSIWLEIFGIRALGYKDADEGGWLG
jgi:hypothetical protein